MADADGEAKRRTGPIVLPPLRGRGFEAFRLVWLVVLLLSVMAVVAGTWYRSVNQERLLPPYYAYGLTLGVVDGEVVRLGRPWAEQKRRTGIEAGDALLAVDGRPLPGGMAGRAEGARRLREAAPTAILLVRDSQGRVERHAVTRSSDHVRLAFAGTGLNLAAQRLLRAVTGLAANLLVIAAAVLLFLRRPRDPVAATLSLALLLQIPFSPEAHAAFDLIGAHDAGIFVTTLGFALLVLGLAVFPDGEVEPRWTLWIIAALPPFYLVYAFQLLPSEVSDLIWLAVLVAGVVPVAWRYRRLPAGRERQQIRWTFFGGTLAVAAATIGIGISIVLPAIDSDRLRIWLPLAGNISGALGFIFMAVGLLVSLLRYRLYDADAVISRSAAYAVMTLAAAAVFAGSAKGLELAMESSFGREAGALPGVAAAALAAALVTPAHNRIHEWAERRFQKGLLHLRRDLPDCVDDLRETATLEELLEEVLARVCAGVRAVRAAVLVGERVAAARGADAGAVAEWRRDARLEETADELDCRSADPLFPMRIPLRVRHAQRAPLGWVLLGPRPDGSFYGKDEREALAEVADPIARAIHIVGRREAGKSALEARLAKLERAVRRLARKGPEAAAAAE